MTKLAVISDVHSNLEALRAVLQEIERQGVDRVLFLGDAVGYGPEPEECVRLLKKHCGLMIAGNHDWATVGLTPVEYFNDNARAAIEWTSLIISPQTKEFLKSLRPYQALAKEDIFLCHGSPRDPEAWNYILSLEDAERAFYNFEEKLCLVGHSHVPFIVEMTEDRSLVVHPERVRMRKGSRYLVNAGSVGQPRDGDPRATMVIIEDDVIEIKRVEYDFRATQAKMLRQGLPESLAQRLEFGR
jgi:predicted phosphodiesterase